jgi:hypothetical protein
MRPVRPAAAAPEGVRPAAAARNPPRSSRARGHFGVLEVAKSRRRSGHFGPGQDAEVATSQP